MKFKFSIVGAAMKNVLLSCTKKKSMEDAPSASGEVRRFPEYWTIQVPLHRKTFIVVSNGTKEGTTYICPNENYGNLIDFYIKTQEPMIFGHDNPMIISDYSPLGMLATINHVLSHPATMHLSAEVQETLNNYHAPQKRLMEKYPGIVF